MKRGLVVAGMTMLAVLVFASLSFAVTIHHDRAREGDLLPVRVEPATQPDTRYGDGWVNVARAGIQEGNMADAEDALRRALALDSGLAKTHYFLGSALKTLGRYDEATAHLREAAARYPRDRVVRNQLGRVLFLQRKYRDAVAEFQKVLEVDPEDLQADYNLMLAYQGMGQADEADRERVLYQRFKADESAQAITGPFRQLHPFDNNERQSVHEHVFAVAAPEGAAARPRSGGSR